MCVNGSDRFDANHKNPVIVVFLYFMNLPVLESWQIAVTIFFAISIKVLYLIQKKAGQSNR